ncbi:MAG: geranylgeranyl diphosphate synthase type II [Candidatus Omnitrophota bacterium]|jgi:geranylgeranyl diphosphate synthase type II
MQIKKLLATRAVQIDKAMDKFLPKNKTYPPILAKAMRYSMFSGGKRVRPFLVLESAKMCGLEAAKAMRIACAVEMVHAYSLVHDDLPSMDDDDFRRGRKTCHKAFDEATAILTGDALLSLAFQIISETKSLPPARLIKAVSILSDAIGPYGMVAGQVADIAYQQQKQGLVSLKKVNELKTGALIRASMELGAIAAGQSQNKVKKLSEFGELIGFLFQLVDDIIDGDGYASLIGIEATYREAARIRDGAKKILKPFGNKGLTLINFVDFLHDRTA